MWKTLIPTVLLWPVLSAAGGSAEERSSIRPGGCVIDRPFKDIITIDIQGKLRKNFDFCGTLPKGIDSVLLRWQWQITAQGKTYNLDLSGARAWARLAEQYQGKTVRIRGRLENRGAMLLQLANEISPCCGDAWVLVVTDMQPVAEHYVHETVEFEVHGKLAFNQKLGLPERVVNIVTTGGRTFVLQMSRTQARLAYKLDGKNVVVKGKQAGTFIEMEWSCLPPELVRGLPILHVTHIAAAEGNGVQRTVRLEAQGTVQRILRQPTSIWTDGGQPMWKLNAGDKTYELELGAFANQVKRLRGKTVKISGRLETRTYCMVRRANGGPVLMDACCVVKTVLVVERIEEVQLEHVRQENLIEARGVLRYQGNRTSGLESTLKYYEWEGYVLDVNGRSYRLEFRNGLPLSIGRMVGQTVVVTGRIEYRFDRPEVPRVYEVIVVTGFQVA